MGQQVSGPTDEKTLPPSSLNRDDTRRKSASDGRTCRSTAEPTDWSCQAVPLDPSVRPSVGSKERSGGSVNRYVGGWSVISSAVR